LLLFSSIGVSLASHFCEGQKIMSELVLMDTHLDCGMEMMACEDEGKETTIKKVCCENTIQYLGQIDNRKSEIQQIEINDFFMIAFVSSYLQINFSEQGNTQITHYSPPILKLDRQVMFQTFIIYA
jgi:hypothetical protein